MINIVAASLLFHPSRCFFSFVAFYFVFIRTDHVPLSTTIVTSTTSAVLSLKKIKSGLCMPALVGIACSFEMFQPFLRMLLAKMSLIRLRLAKRWFWFGGKIEECEGDFQFFHSNRTVHCCFCSPSTLSNACANNHLCRPTIQCNLCHLIVVIRLKSNSLKIWLRRNI